MVSSMDHKRALDGDKGLNTGGMGVIAPNPYYTDEIAKLCMETIFLPTMRAMNAKGNPFQGLPVLRADADQGRPQGDRVQLPLRRSRGAGGAAAFGKRSVFHLPARDERNAARRRTCGFPAARAAAWCWRRAGIRRRTKRASRSRALRRRRAQPDTCVFHAGTRQEGEADRHQRRAGAGRDGGRRYACQRRSPAPTPPAELITFRGRAYAHGHRRAKRA